MLGPQDVGSRVVVRHVVGVRDGRPLFTDVLGELIEWADTELIVNGKNGPVSIRLAAIVAGKRIPPRRTATQPTEPSADADSADADSADAGSADSGSAGSGSTGSGSTGSGSTGGGRR